MTTDSPGPLNVVVAPIGSRGDVQPMLALALGLRGRGHRVTVAAPSNFEAWIRSHDLPFAPCGPDAVAMVREAGDRAQSTRHQMRLLKDLVRDQFLVMPRICRGADLVVGAGLQVAGPSVAERVGAAYAYVAYAPVVVRSASHPPPFVRRYDRSAAANRMWWKVFDWMVRLGLSGLIRQGRRTMGLGPVGDVLEHLESPAIVLAADRALIGDPDLTENVHRTPSLQLPAGGALSAEARAFLERGDPPVLVGFGSMASSRAGEVLDLFVRAAERVGVRLLIQPGWATVRREAIDAAGHCAVIGPEPHGALLPLVRAAVHHGGAGTTTSVARAGRPQLLVPHLLDQYYWAHRVRTLGLGPAALPVRKARRVAAVAERLEDLVATASYAGRAREVSRSIDGDGVADAAAFLEKLAVGR